jgi:hypothetical protein
MKAKIVPILISSALFSLILSSCEDSTYKEYKGNTPVYLTYEGLRSSVSLNQNIDLNNPGKIYFKDNYIFIVEELKGIHVFDNTDPSAPVKKVFVNLPGVVDMAIAGNIMYADSYVDIVILDLQDVLNIHEVGRMKDVIPYTIPATGNDYPQGYIDQKLGVVVSWELKTIRERIYNNPSPYPIYTFDKTSNVFYGSQISGITGTGVGIGGSMARFGIKDNILYLVGNSTLKIIDITSKTNPVKLNDIYPGSNLETMFLIGNKMFLGTTTGMIIYDISVPSSPASRIFFTHARSCDPVIVDDTLAYITLRTGTRCASNLNNLVIVNVKDITHPVEVITYPLTNPHGLGKSGSTLFVCDGNAGLKIFNATNPKQLFSNVIKTYPGIDAYDVIPLPNDLVMIGDSGLYQYDYSNILNITLLSKIRAVPK